MSALPKELTMRVELSVIENLGFRMYTRLPAVIAELVANCWDAEATEVNVDVSDTDPKVCTVTISDNGMGMSWDNVDEQYLKVGRKRREELGTDLSVGSLMRRVMGRKGIGKLSAFGIAKQIEVFTVRDFQITHFLMGIEDILNTAKKGEPYHPILLKMNGRKFKSEHKDREHLTRVALKGIQRKTSIDIGDLRQSLARRFAVIGEDFVVKVNGEAITPEERNLREKCEFVWDIPGDLLGDVSDEHPDWKVTGWIGTFEKPVPASLGAGIVLMAKGKLAEEPTTFKVGQMRAQHALAYLVGEVHAEFLDDEIDWITVYRGSIVWDSEVGETLKNWGDSTIRRVAEEWATKRREKKAASVFSVFEFKEWYEHLNKKKREKMDRIIDVITTGQDDDPKRTRALVHYVIQAFDQISYSELLDELQDLPVERARELLDVFHEWRLIEAREMYRIIDGRYQAIKTLDDMVKRNAKEVPEIHKFLVENPWILEPTWTIVHDEVYFTTLVKKEFPEAEKPEENKRIDLFCVGVGDVIYVAELKRPSVEISMEEFTQVGTYVAFLEKCLGTDSKHSYRLVRGYLVGSSISEYARSRLEKTPDISYLSYTDLLSNAEKIHKEYLDVLRKFSDRPEIAAFVKDAEALEKAVAGDATEETAATAIKG